MTAGAEAGGAFAARFTAAREAFERGDVDGAERLIGAVAAPEFGPPGAHWLATWIAAARGRLDQARGLAERLIARSDLDPEARADAILLLGQVLDRLGRSAEAFSAARQGKALQRRLSAARAAGREGETGKLQRLAAWFGARSEWRAAPAMDADPAAPTGHVFLAGFPRSGTTLLEQALVGHPEIVALEEAPTFADHYAEFQSSAAGLERLARLNGGEAAVWRARYWAVVRAQGADPRGRVFVDKAPAGTLYMPILAKLFPDAKILFAVRDPRDVILSCFLNTFQMNAVTYTFTDLMEAARCYAASMALAETYRRLLPLAWRDVRYENLVEDFDSELAAIAEFIGAKFDPGMADVAATAARRVVRTPSAIHVRAGLNRQGLDHWRPYADELVPVRGMLAPWIERFGYPAD